MIKIVNVKDTLANSLIELSYSKPISKITVQDITGHCNAGRQTFYNHFVDKYDLINWIYKEKVEKVLAMYREDRNWQDCMRDTYLIFLENKQFFTKIADLTEFIDYFYTHTRDYYIASIVNRFGKDEITASLIYSIEFNCYGQVNMCLKWIKEGMKDSAKEMANKNIENIPPNLMKYFDWESKEAVDESLSNDGK